MILPLLVCYEDNSSCQQIVRIYCRVGCTTSNKQVDFGGDPDHNADTGVFFPLQFRDN